MGMDPDRWKGTDHYRTGSLSVRRLGIAEEDLLKMVLMLGPPHSSADAQYHRNFLEARAQLGLSDGFHYLSFYYWWCAHKVSTGVGCVSHCQTRGQ
jgi:hypothetical protein